jgi:hypothetical protein
MQKVQAMPTVYAGNILSIYNFTILIYKIHSQFPLATHFKMLAIMPHNF